MIKSIVILFIFVLLSACGTAPVKEATIKDVIEIREGVDSIPLAFNKIIVKLRRLEEIGKSSGGALCIPMGPIEWQGGRVNITDSEFTEIFRDEFLKANYPIVGDPNALFEDPELAKAELLITYEISILRYSNYYLKIIMPRVAPFSKNIWLKVAAK